MSQAQPRLTVAEYLADLLVVQDHVRVEQYVRQSEQKWLLTEAASLDDVVRLASVGCELPLAEIYDRVVLDE